MSINFINSNNCLLLYPHTVTNTFIFCNIVVCSSHYSSLTNNNTPSMPLRDAHLEGFFFLCYE